MTTHTQGPWTLRRHATNHQTLTGATAGLIADIHKDEDARLIAAAPELLEVLREIVCAAEAGELDEYGTSGDWYRDARAAIHKATGEAA